MGSDVFGLLQAAAWLLFGWAVIDSRWSGKAANPA